MGELAKWSSKLDFRLTVQPELGPRELAKWAGKLDGRRFVSGEDGFGCWHGF